MSEVGSESGRRTGKGKSTKKMVDPKAADIQIRNLDGSVKRLTQQKAKWKKQMAEDEKELAWVMAEIKQFEAKKEKVLEIKRTHEQELQILTSTQKDCKDKLQNEVLADASELLAQARKAQRSLQKKEFVSPHKKR